MKFSNENLKNVQVSVLSEIHKPSYPVKCESCGHEWSLLVSQKGFVRRGEWKCVMCHPPKRYLEFAEDMMKEWLIAEKEMNKAANC
jgi:hypothetical protein